MYVYCYPIKKRSIINYLKPGNPGDIFNIVANIHFASAFRAPTAYLEILRDRRGTFDPSKRSRKQISDILMEVKVPAKAQRITALRVDDSFDVIKDAKQLIVAHKDGATIMDVTPN